MKKILIIFTATLVLYACVNKSHNKSFKLNERNYTISRDNAYNTLFIDSIAFEKFIKNEKIEASLAAMMRSFYNKRNFEYAWFSGDGVAEEALSFSTFYKYDSDTSFSKSLQYLLDDLAAEDSIKLTEKNQAVAKTELQLTKRFLQYFTTEKHLTTEQAIQHFIPAKKSEALYTADSLLKENNAYLDGNMVYRKLLEQLKKYTAIAKKGGWAMLDSSLFKYSNSSSSSISLLKKRLHVTGEYAPADTSGTINKALDSAIKLFQITHGHKPTGKWSNALLREMNITAMQRVQQLIINLQRMKWMPIAENGKLIVVNLPEYVLYAYNAKQKIFAMPVVVGKEGHSTIMFYGTLNEIVFSPYWNIPPSIVANEILPKMKEDKHYLKKQNMEILREENGLPVIRQLPGDNNSLGKVKFLFPNSFNIYFHDTNAKELFKREKRTYSHGCIRLEEPAKMVQYILEDTVKWSAANINKAMNAGKEKYVNVKNPVPVVITYYTAWVDDLNELHFADDIYGHDSALAKKMFIQKP